MSDEKNKPVERPQLPPDESLYLRPSAAPQITSLDQLYSYNNYYQPGGEEGFNYRDIWRKIRKRKWLILSIVFIATTLVSIESFRTKSLYLATSKVAFNQESTVIKAGDLILQTDDGGRIRTELLMLKTYPLLEDVVVRLQLDKNPNFLDIGGRKSVPEAIETIFSKFSKPPTGPPEIPQMAPLVIEPNLQAGRSEEEIARLAPYVGILENNLQVAQIEDTSAIELKFTHTNPAIAATVANGVARVFVENSFTNKTEKFINSANWLDRTTRGLLAQVQQAEQALANYSSSHNIFSTDESSSSLTAEKLGSIYGQALKAETDRILKQSIYEEVQKGRVAQLPEAFSDSRTAQYQTDLSKLQIKAAELNARYGLENPKVVEIQQQIKELQGLIGGNVRNLEEKLRADYERAVRDENLIKQSLERAKSEAAQQNQASIQFNILKQNVDTTKSLYNDFLQKTNQANIQRAEQYNDMRIIDPARVPGGPTGPNRLRSILLGMMLSLAAGIGLALFIEFLDSSVKSIEDVSRAVQLPTLALIPAMKASTVRVMSAKKKSELRDAQNKRITEKLTEISGLAPRTLHPNDNRLATLDGLSSVVEAYRMLRTSVLLSTAGMPPKTILITSSQPGEGKTTTAVNTAISLAQLGAKVLLIDADLRRPAVHKTFKLQQSLGLSSYLSGNGAIEDLIVKLTSPNLSVLTSGPIPPNPAELISSERMRDMLKSLAETYDHIIIDSPPLIHVTDPVILSTMVDGSILIVQSGRSSREMLRRAKQELVGVGAKIFGIVLNNVDVRKEGYDEYYYHRHYSSYNESQKGAKAG